MATGTTGKASMEWVDGDEGPAATLPLPETEVGDLIKRTIALTISSLLPPEVRNGNSINFWHTPHPQGFINMDLL